MDYIRGGWRRCQSDVIKWARKEFEILACSTREAEFQEGVLWGSEKWRAKSVPVWTVSKWLSDCAPALHMEPELCTPVLPSNKTALSNHMHLVSFPFCLLPTWEKTPLMGRGEFRLPFWRSILWKQRTDVILQEARWIVIFRLEIPITESWRLRDREEIPGRSHTAMHTFDYLDSEVTF